MMQAKRHKTEPVMQALHKPLMEQGSVKSLDRMHRMDTATTRLCDVTGNNDEFEVRRLSTWEKADEGSRTPFQDSFGVKFLRHYDASHADKLLEYDSELLEARPWAIIFSTTVRASVLALPHVLRSMLYCGSTSVALLGLSLLFEDDVMTTLSAVNSTVSAGLFFLLGPFVALCIARWWQMRMDLLGGVWGVISDLNCYATVWFNSGSTADREARAIVKRYGFLAHLLLYKDARGQTDLDDAVGKGLLLPHEAEVLTPLPSRTQMVFTWLLDFWSRALAEDGARTLGTTTIPHAATQAPIVLKRCLDGRGAAGGALALVYTQLPFPYVHLLSCLVQVACVTNAAVQGARTGWILSAPTCLGDAVEATAHTFRYEVQPGCPPALFVYHWTATLFILIGLVISVIVYPIIFHGLLSIGVMLSNPLGAAYIDFPGSFYHHVMKAELNGFDKCVDAINLDGRKGSARWWSGLAR